MLSMIVHTDCSYSARIAIKLHSNSEIYIVDKEKKKTEMTGDYAKRLISSILVCCL